jgi:hypothetical protein
MEIAMKTDYRCLHDNPLLETEGVLSNFDHEFDASLATELEGGETMADYAGWNFHAYVYMPADLYVADVHCYGSHRDFITGTTLGELMENVSERFGHE